MPREQIYDREPAVRPAPAQGMASPEAFGAGVGRGLEQLGRTLTDIEVRNRAEKKADDREAQNAKAAVDFATGAAAYSKRVRDLQEEAQPDAAGHIDAVTNEGRAWSERFLEGIPDARVRNRWAGRMAEVVARTVDDEDAWSRGRKSEAALNNLREADGARQMQLETNPDEAVFHESINDLHASADSLNQTPAVQKKYLEEQEAAYAVSFAQGLIRSNALLGQHYLESGALDAYLRDPKLKLQLLGHADVGVRAQEAEVARTLATLKSQTNQEVTLFSKRLADHDPTITDADIEAMGSKASAVGLTGDVYDLAKARTEHAADVEFGKAAPAEISHEIDAINARIAEKGDKASADDVVRRDHLLSLRDKRKAAIAGDPIGELAATGGKAGDLGSPAGIAQRIVAANTARDRFGKFSFFRPDELTSLRDQLASGPDGRLEVSGLLASVAERDPQAALRAATELAPNDRILRQTLRVPPGVRPLLQRGAAALATVPPKLVGADGQATTADAATKSWFAGNVAPAMLGAQPEFVADVLASAQAVYAEHRRRAGATGDDDFNPGAFKSAVDLVLGGDGRAGGVARWRAGPRGPDGKPAPFLLPQGMTLGGFARRLDSLPIARLGQKFPQGSVNGAPVWADGSPMNTDDLRSKFVPVKVGGSVYQFQAGNQAVHTRDGKLWQLDVGKLPEARAPVHPKPGAAAARGPAYIAPPDLHPNVRGPVYIGAPGGED